MILPITLTIAAALAVLNVALAIRIVRRRIGGGVMTGTGGDAGMEVLVRAHGNLVEFAPFFLILLALIELAGASPTWTWIAGVAFVLVRLAHAYGMGVDTPNPFRAGGALGTAALLVLMAGWAIAIAYGSDAPGDTIVVDQASVRA